MTYFTASAKTLFSDKVMFTGARGWDSNVCFAGGLTSTHNTQSVRTALSTERFLYMKTADRPLGPSMSPRFLTHLGCAGRLSSGSLAPVQSLLLTKLSGQAFVSVSVSKARPAVKSWMPEACCCAPKNVLKNF